jgi:predicted RNA-binding Zn ribbon-like protein
MTPARAINEASLVAGNLALDFINTSTSRHSTVGVWLDYMTDALEVLIWLRLAQAVNETRFREMTVIISNDDGKSRIFMSKTLALRKALGEIVNAVSHGQSPNEHCLAVLNEVLAEAKSAQRLGWTEEGPELSLVVTDRQSLNDALWSIAFAAESLLTGDNINRIKCCGSSTCEWLFLDESKNGSRLWCQMEVCGNREKGRRRLTKAKSLSLVEI